MAPGFVDRAMQGVNCLPLRLQWLHGMLPVCPARCSGLLALMWGCAIIEEAPSIVFHHMPVHGLYSLNC